MFWETTKEHVQGPTGKSAWLAIFNPDRLEQSGPRRRRSARGWAVIQVNALDHPNVRAELRGEPAPFPAAVRLDQVADWLRDWCDPIESHRTPPVTDLEWPPGSGQWLRPGPLAESRVLGRWPSQAAYAVWS